MRIRKAVGAIISWKDNPGHILLVKKVKAEDIHKGDIEPEWDIPKGGIADGERPDGALWRELGEEVGSKKFMLVAELPFRMDFEFPRGSRWERQETVLFCLEYEGMKAAFTPSTDEIAEAKMIEISEARNLLRYDTTIKAMDQAISLGFLK